MKELSHQQFDEERALYGSKDLLIQDCIFDGPKDGESFLKECSNIALENSYCALRYPFWHNRGLKIADCSLTDGCRAALWYSDHIAISNTSLHGIKALRECSDVTMSHCDIESPEFGWSVNNIELSDTNAVSEYFMMRSTQLQFKRVRFKGKYSFQYTEDGTIEDCIFDTKDAFWHSHHLTVKNSTIKGEYLAWYSDHLTLDHCRIIGTQPFCYCTNLKLIDCEMINTDLAFEKSDVEATVLTSIDSVKNPKSGTIKAPFIQELIMDDPEALGNVIISKH